MPIVNDDEIKTLLADEKVSALTVDTNIFDEKGLKLNSPALKAIAGIKDKPIDFLLSGTVAKEIQAHLLKETDGALRAVGRSIGQALGAFDTKAPTREELINQISGGRSAEEAAEQRFNQYVEDTGCVVLDDAKLVDVETLFSGYFGGQPPFGSGKKKNEFPDALALNALEATAKERGARIFVVSKDGDWKAFCENSEYLYLVPEIERALALIKDAPLGLRKAIFDWIANEADGVENFKAEISRNAERIDFSVNAYPTNGEVEIFTWDAEFQRLVWPDEKEIDIIELLDPTENGALRVVASLPLILTVKFPIELNFSIYDSVDRESLGMGGRMIEVVEDIYVLTAVTLDVHGLGSDDEEIECVESELDAVFHVVELGEVDMFEPEDYRDG